MRSGPFSLLCLVCFLLLLGLRFVLPGVAGKVEAAVAPSSSESMAVPPKPEGMEPTGAPLDAEGSGQGRLSAEACEGLATDVQDICWQALARQQGAVDPEAALALCPKIQDKELRLECSSDVAEAVAPVSRQRAEQICDTIDSVKWRGQCHFGTGLALAELDPGYAMGRCEHAEIFKLFCRHDVVGEIALVNVDFAVQTCAKEEGGELQRKTCWHGIGKYLARRDMTEAEQACNRTTPQWVGNCYHGLGWGAAERDVEAALKGCEKFGSWRENCRQGVAHQQKRVDPDRALSLCQSIVDERIRTRCIDFVSR
jgi:hypothetical protein